MKLDPWQRYTLTPNKKSFIGLRFRASLSGMLMPTAFAPLSIVSVKKIMVVGYNAARGLISRDIARVEYLHLELMRKKILSLKGCYNNRNNIKENQSSRFFCLVQSSFFLPPIPLKYNLAFLLSFYKQP